MQREQTSIINENLRLLLWSEKINRREWAERLARWAKCSRRRAEEILIGADPVASELVQIAQVVGVTEDMLLYHRLLSLRTINVFNENIQYILDSLDYGDQKDLAHSICVHPTTISRWKRGTLRPSGNNLCALADYFELPTGVSLKRDPIFLSIIPISGKEMRLSLRKIIDSVDTPLLRTIYTAIVRFYLSGDPHAQ